MEKSIAVLHLTSKKDVTGILNLVHRVIAGLSSDTEDYPAPDPSVEVLQSDADLLEQLAQKALVGTHADIVARNEQAAVVYDDLKKELIYVNIQGHGDEAILLKSGFDTQRVASKLPLPGKTVIVSVTFGKEDHSAKFTIKKVDYAKKYRIAINNVSATSDDWTYIELTSSTRELIVTGLTRGKECWFRIAAGNSSGWGEWSEPIAFIAK
mgnify:CR=1 FL=1